MVITSAYKICKRATFVVLVVSVVLLIFATNSNVFIFNFDFRGLRTENITIKPVTVRVEFKNARNTSKPKLVKVSFKAAHSHLNESIKYLIDTVGCKIPQTPIMPSYFKKKWSVQNIPNCGYERRLSELNEESQVLTLLPGYDNRLCCLRQITRLNKSDWSLGISKCESDPFQPNQPTKDVRGKEMFITKCGRHLNFEANIPTKPKVKEKIAFWNEFLPEDSPAINILIVGIDSVSRSHAHRSLPKTINAMREMGFVDFRGYHSVAPSTLSNFMAFLMGLTRRTVRKSCAPNWKSPFDSCPFIWKEFDFNNYVTMYVEDGTQTFNWGGQSGFSEQPTDYYLHPLFSAIEELRSKEMKIHRHGPNADLLIPCTSNETVPQFMLHYTQRFINKFQNTPFFAFTWFGNPFHDYMFSLPNFDKDFVKFIEVFKTHPELLEKTAIVFVSDHGDRTIFFESRTMDAFIERGLPPLFMRIPEKFKKMHPDLNLDDILKQNQNSLISPFDLHHTFLHILSLMGLNSKSLEAAAFEPVLSDRQSILVPIPPTRNCEGLNIEIGSCVCGTSPETQPLKNPFYLNQIISLVEARLNQIVESSKYKSNCAKWTTRVSWILSTQILQKNWNHTDVLLQFSADPGGAQFEAKIRVMHELSNYDGSKLIGQFARINAYGNQSSCIGFKTDADKEMKQFCMCKSMVSTTRRT